LIDEELGPSETANIAVALASLGCCSGGLDKYGRAFEGRAFASIGRRASVSIETYDSAALSSLVWAFAVAKQELACLAKAAERFISIDSWDAPSLANACWGLASLNAPLDWSRALGRARAVDASGGDLAKLVWALYTNGQDVSSLAETVGDIEKWPPSAVARLAVGLCAGDYTEVLLKIAAHLRERHAEYASSELVDVAYALSKTDARAVDLALANIDASALDGDALARLFEALSAAEPPADVVAKAVHAACDMKLWRPAALVTVAGRATDAALMDALAQAAVGLRDGFEGAQRRRLREALGARLPADFDKAEVAAIAELPLEPAAPPVVARPPPPPLITGPSLLPAFLQDKLRGDFLG